MHRGFSLLEIVLVCGLVTSVSTLGLSIMQAIDEHQKLQLAGESLCSAVAGARLQAVTKNLALQLQVHSNRQQFSLVVRGEAPTIWQTLPKGVQFSQIPGRPVTFYSRGYAAPAGSFVLTNRSGLIRVIVSPSGRTRWERTI